MPYAPLTVDAPFFAPKVDRLEVGFHVPRSSGAHWVELQVTDRNGLLVFKEAGTLDQRSFFWDGGIRTEGTGPSTRWVNPLRAPFEVRVELKLTEHDAPRSSFKRSVRTRSVMRCPPREEDLSDAPTRESVDVLYESVEIVACPWKPELLGSSAPDERPYELLAALLNQRGYHAGPVWKARRSAQLQRALRRFHFHSRALRSRAFEEIGTSEWLEAIQEAEPLFPAFSDRTDEPIETGKVLPSERSQDGPLRIHVEAIGYEIDYDNRYDEFKAQLKGDELKHKWQFEAERLNRPSIPLLAVVTLKGKDCKPKLVPEAVGPLRVLWEVQYPSEDVSTLPLAPAQHSRPRTYVGSILREVRRTHKSTNCPEELGGTLSDQPWRDPYREGETIPGFRVRPDPRRNAVYTLTAFDEGSPLRGRAAVYFEPSIIAGDRYRLKATLDFSEEPGRERLEMLHGELSFTTAMIEVWRRVRLAAVIGWPERDGYDGFIPQVAAEYRHAYTLLDIAETEYLAIDDLLKQEDYTAWLAHAFELMDLANDHPRRKVLDPQLSGLSPLRATNMEQVSDWKQQLAVATVSVFSEISSPGAMPSASFLGDRIARRLARLDPQLPWGVVVLDYRWAEQVRDVATEVLFEPPSLSVGMERLFAVTDQDVPGTPYFLFAHEIGHCFWLCHHENAGDKNPQDHDAADHGCIMSYTTARGMPHQRAESYRPHFCGRCLLKLRGWNLRARDLKALERSAATRSLKSVVYYDAAEKELLGDQEAAIVARCLQSRTFAPTLVRSVDRDIESRTKQWLDDLSDCDVYHHVSHGNVYHAGYGRRAASLEYFTPRYPICADPKLKEKLELTEEHLFANSPKQVTAWYEDSVRKFLQPEHALWGVIQWASTGLNQSTVDDVMFGPDTVAMLGERAPRLLVVLSCCLAGWNPVLPKAFLDGGTRFVIAFRARYQTNNAVPFTEAFYTAWEQRDLHPEMIPTCFLQAAWEFPHAEPALFTQDEIIKVWAKKKVLGSEDDVGRTTSRWDDLSGFMKPSFHT